MNLDQISVEALQESAQTYRKDLVRLPVIGLASSSQFMTIRPGVRYKETVFSPDFNAELQAYEVAERKEVDGSFNPRSITTEFGACFFDFDPNKVISSILGHRASQAGEGAKDTVTAREVVASVIKSIGKGLNVHLFDAVNGDGKSTATLFDGFDTITDREIAAGNISEEKGNLIVLTEPITEQNAGQVLKDCMKKMTDELRDEETYIYCSRSIVDAYNENYLLTHSGINYNTQYKQPYLEGSGDLMTFAPMVGKKKSKYIHITTKGNMLIGVDQMSDQERVEVNKYGPKVLTGELYMFFGTEFESIDPRRMVVIKLPEEANG